jgi:hypothetical protein
MRMSGQRHASAALPPGKKRVPTLQKAGWVPWKVWTSAENLSHTELRYLDLPARNEALNRLRYSSVHGDSILCVPLIF